jgi:hypothetical protein
MLTHYMSYSYIHCQLVFMNIANMNMLDIHMGDDIRIPP